MSDPHVDNVSLLLRGDGAGGSTTITDSSPRTKAVTAHGGAAISVTKGGFDGSCIDFGSEGAYLAVQEDADLAFGAGDFTVELWVKPRLRTNTALIDFYAAGLNVGWSLQVWDGNAVFSSYNEDFSVDEWWQGAAQLADGKWSHIAVTRESGTLRIFVNGASDGEFAISANYANPIALCVGRFSLDGNSEFEFKGQIDDLRITKGVARYTSAFAITEYPLAGVTSPLGIVTATANSVPPETSPSPLGAAAAVALFTPPPPLYPPGDAYIKASGPLGRAKVVAFHDFTGQLGDDVTLFVMDLITPGGTVRTPISSWQATLQTGSSNYVQCVIPACTPWQYALNDATEFVIYRRAVLVGGTPIEHEMARAPADQLQFDRGPRRDTCTLSGYSDAFAENDNPPAVYDRTLTGVRSISSGTSYRVRCSVDWLLRPGHRAFVSGAPFVVKFINYYAPSEWDSYMDAGG